MRRFSNFSCILLPLCAWSASATLSHGLEQATNSVSEQLRLEAHAFVSFGYFRTWENNYLAADSMDGSTDFYEAAMNASIRPWDRVRIGAQLYLRDLGRYENGEPRIDWAFAEYTADQAAVFQVGRVKVPGGLYNDLQDIDPARTSVFLPQSIYPIRLRDSQVGVDGGKFTGFFDELFGNGVSYAIYGGTKNIDSDSAFAQSTAERSFGTATDVDVDAFFGGMLHWNTPINELGLRLSGNRTDNITVITQTSFGQATQTTDVDIVVLSAEWQSAHWTFASEYAYSRNKGVTNSPALPNVERDYHGGYINATWHAAKWLDTYGAIEYQYSDTNGTSTDGWAYVAAINIMPLSNWSIKAEFQLHDGPIGISKADNPQGVSNSWQMLALKTTVDF